MISKFSFHLQSEDRKRKLPEKVIIGRKDTETEKHVLLKLLAYVLFYRDRLQIEPRPHQDSIPFIPDVAQFDYELRPKLWVECGECSVAKLDKLAVKAPEATLWIVKASPGDAAHLLAAIRKARLRSDRYHLIGLDWPMVEEMLQLIASRNELLWVEGDFEEQQIQCVFNGLWFDTRFEILHH